MRDGSGGLNYRERERERERDRVGFPSRRDDSPSRRVSRESREEGE